MAVSMNQKFRVVKRDPKDPTWLYPFARRERIEGLRVYFSTFHKRRKSFASMHAGRRFTGILYHLRKNKIPWESVAPWNRPAAQAWFDKKIAEYKAQGRTITWGIINSVRMNATRFGRSVRTGEAMGKYITYGQRKALWLNYQAWESKQQRQAHVEATGGLPHKVLEL